MKLNELEQLHYKGSVELGRESHRYTVDVFYDPDTKTVYQVIRDLNKWRKVASGSKVSQEFVEDEWTSLE